MRWRRGVVRPRGLRKGSVSGLHTVSPFLSKVLRSFLRWVFWKIGSQEELRWLCCCWAGLGWDALQTALQPATVLENVNKECCQIGGLGPVSVVCGHAASMPTRCNTPNVNASWLVQLSSELFCGACLQAARCIQGKQAPPHTVCHKTPG